MESEGAILLLEAEKRSRNMHLFFILFFCGLLLSPLSPCSLLLSSVVGEKNPSILTFLEPVAPGLSGPLGFW